MPMTTTAMADTSLPIGLEGTRAVVRMDEDAFRAFYDRTARPLLAYLQRLTGDAELADDLVQEAYYRFYRAGTDYEDETHRRNSLYRIATNAARDVGRRRKRGTDVPIPDDLAATDAAPDQRTDLARALQRLKPLQREMLWLAYGQGASYAEIAEIVGISINSIKQTLF